jgi:hypothetical protein
MSHVNVDTSRWSRRTLQLAAAALATSLSVALPATTAPQVVDTAQGGTRRQEPGGVAGSVHQAQLRELGERAHPPTDDDHELAADAARLAAARRGGVFVQPLQGTTTIDRDFVVFGYLQSETQVPHLRWHALTHVGSLFVGFDANGQLTGTSAFTGRSSYLRAGGAAQAAGVKVVLVLANFDDSSGGAIATVMTSPARRATLIGQLVNLLAADGYSHGVSLDLEFSWGTAVRDGVTAFMRELDVALAALGPQYELSIYTNAIYSASQWNFDAVTGITPAVDYMLYSMYDWASGNTAHAISDFDNCLGATRMQAYLNAGLPPEKLVPVVSAYSRQWTGTNTYNGVGTSSSSSGFTDALYDVTLRPTIGPAAARYVRGDEGGWYTWNDGTQRTRTWDSLESMEVKVRHALAMQDPAGAWNGRRLGGVGFWSLMWMSEFTSIDPRTGGSVARTRTYPHVYQLCHEVFSPTGTQRFVLDGFAGLDPRWRDPNEARDTSGDTDSDSYRALVPAWNGGGNALRLGYDFEATGANRAVFSHEVLASPLAPTITDIHSALGFVARSTRIVARVNSTVASPNHAVRMLVLDAEGHMESSPAFSLGVTGPRELVWDLSDAQSVTPFATSEPAHHDGDGVMDSFLARDIGFYGFLVQGQGVAQGSLDVDEIGYERIDPAARAYRINELRYADASLEFVELHGPAGPLPFGLELRVYDASDGSVAVSFPVFGTVPDDGGGEGFFVLGDPGVPNVDSTFGFAAARDDIANLDPSALQLYDAVGGHDYDSVVLEAFGGLDDLVRLETRGVTAHGGPWLGEVGPGRDSNGQPYAMGRYPDGHDTRENAADFSFLRASPGQPNGGTVVPPVVFDFEAPVAALFQTYDAPRRVDPVTVGLPRSQDGGLAWRCVDAAGGGVIGVVGDAALGGTRGFGVSGEVFVPSASAPAQALGIGLCGAQGSTFFTASPSASGHESGYWLVYENRAGVQLADGRADHPGVWELVHATHDNQDGAPVQLLASVSNSVLGVVPGKWAHFEVVFEPNPFGAAKLLLTLNGKLVFDGELPLAGPQRGAFQVGFRENHSGGPAASEGTWIDALSFR